MPTSAQSHINQSCEKREKWSLISAAHLVFQSSLPPSQHIRLPPPRLHLSGPLHLCQTALWSVASQVTWANRRLYIPAEHCFALREFPPLSLPLSSLFVSIPTLQVHPSTVCLILHLVVHFEVLTRFFPPDLHGREESLARTEALEGVCFVTTPMCTNPPLETGDFIVRWVSLD